MGRKNLGQFVVLSCTSNLNRYWEFTSSNYLPVFRWYTYRHRILSRMFLVPRYFYRWNNAHASRPKPNWPQNTGQACTFRRTDQGFRSGHEGRSRWLRDSFSWGWCVGFDLSLSSWSRGDEEQLLEINSGADIIDHRVAVTPTTV